MSILRNIGLGLVVIISALIIVWTLYAATMFRWYLGVALGLLLGAYIIGDMISDDISREP